MVLCDGVTVKERIGRGELSLRELLSVGAQAASRLAAAHATGVVHRDFKPANIIITRTGRVKIVDFGRAVAERQVGSVFVRTRRPVLDRQPFALGHLVLADRSCVDGWRMPEGSRSPPWPDRDDSESRWISDTDETCWIVHARPAPGLALLGPLAVPVRPWSGP